MKKIALIAFIMLPALCWGQDFIIPKKGNMITAYNLGKRGEYVTYMKDSTHTGSVYSVALSDIFYLSVKENYAVDTRNYPAVADEDAVYDVLQRGKCLYVPTDSKSPVGRAAQMVCKDMLQRWGYWTVVDTPQQAHFYLIFNYDDKGKGRKKYNAYIRLYSKAAYNSEQSAFESKHIAVMTQPTSENLVENAQVAMDMMEKIMDEIVTEAGNEKSVLNRGTEFYVPANRNALEWFTYKVSR